VQLSLDGIKFGHKSKNIKKLCDLLVRCHLLDELSLNDCGIIKSSNIIKILCSIRECYTLGIVNMVQNFTDSEATMLMNKYLK